MSGKSGSLQHGWHISHPAPESVVSIAGCFPGMGDLEYFPEKNVPENPEFFVYPGTVLFRRIFAASGTFSGQATPGGRPDFFVQGMRGRPGVQPGNGPQMCDRSGAPDGSATCHGYGSTPETHNLRGGPERNLRRYRTVIARTRRGAIPMTRISDCLRISGRVTGIEIRARIMPGLTIFPSCPGGGRQ